MNPIKPHPDGSIGRLLTFVLLVYQLTVMFQCSIERFWSAWSEFTKIRIMISFLALRTK